MGVIFSGALQTRKISHLCARRPKRSRPVPHSPASLKHNKSECGKISAQGINECRTLCSWKSHTPRWCASPRVVVVSSSRNTADWRGCSVNVIMPTNIKSCCLAHIYMSNSHLPAERCRSLARSQALSQCNYCFMGSRLLALFVWPCALTSKRAGPQEYARLRFIGTSGRAKGPK